MKTIRIEKNIQLHETIDEVSHVVVNETLKYQKVEDGMKAIGQVFIKGQYISQNQSKEFKDVLEMDVLAPNEKLSQNAFQLKISNYEASFDQEQIKVQIVFEILGLKVDENDEVEDEVIQVDHYEESEPIPLIQEPVLNQEVSSPIVHNELEDLFEDEGNVYTTYRIAVAKKNDTYSSIAMRYEVNESDLRETNRNKEVQGKSLVILPYGKDAIDKNHK
ncbi:MAG: LysM peptidoglycan-binding domain-containing protein [Erysipelotrichaceae bacterium]